MALFDGFARWLCFPSPDDGGDVLGEAGAVVVGLWAGWDDGFEVGCEVGWVVGEERACDLAFTLGGALAFPLCHDNAT